MLNARRLARDLVVVGASAGGVQALMQLLEALPADFPAAAVIVLHRSPFYETQLPAVLGRHASIKVTEPADGEPLRSGTAYVAPRDQHVLVEDGRLRLTRGPKEHRTRPAIDPLFRSAAAVYGARVVGVLLSGMGADGVSGLIAIKKAGGISLVQKPEDARFPVMPLNAIARDDVDAVLSIDEIATTLPALAAGGTVGDSPRRAAVP
jgi:two-component system chemotaxis response regulator CheB